MIQPNNQDMFVLLSSTVRYSLGRRTYMSSYATDMVLKYQEYLEDWQLKQIADEIEDEIDICEKNDEFCGDQWDHLSWKQSIDRIRELLEERDERS